MQVLVDTNPAETPLHDSLHGLLAAGSSPRGSLSRKRLDVGDVEIRFEDRVFVIERKASLADLCAGFQDGRYHEQKSRLVHAGDEGEKRTPLYVIEGLDVIEWSDNPIPYSGVRYDQVQAAIVKTSLRDGIPVLFSRNCEETARLVAYIAKQISLRGFEPKNVSHLAGARVAKRKRQCTADKLWATMLSTIPGMGMARAQRVAAAYPTLSALAAASEEELADVAVAGGRRLGPALAKVLHAL